MEEASRCDRLLLMYDGLLIADDTPDGIRHAAGTDDLDACFLALVNAHRTGAAR
jgi:ABC-2 type transport system ATP-binding protein